MNGTSNMRARGRTRGMRRAVVSMALAVSAGWAAPSQGATTQQSQDATTGDGGVLLPSVAIEAILLTQRAEPERDQVEIVEPFLSLVQRTGLATDEEFSLGELFFLHFDPDPAKEQYVKFLEGDDWLARVAWQRMMQMNFRAYDDPAQVESDLPEFIERFGASSPHDIFGLAQQVGNFADLHRSNGELQRAIDIVDTEARRVGFEAPYFSHVLVARFLDLYTEADREAEARALMEFSIRGLEDALANRLNRGPTLEEEVGPPMPASLARWYWLWQGVDGSRPVFEVRNRQYQAYIDRLKKALSDFE